MFQLSPSWEIGFYVLMMLFLWTMVRFIASSLMNVFSTIKQQEQNVDPFINGVHYPVSYWTDKGGRPYQEDRHQEKKGPNDCSLYGVFDGHGGYRAAQYCKDYLLQAIIKDSDLPSNPSKAIHRSFYKVDAEFSAKAKVQMLTDGSTAIVAVIQNSRIFVGNAGDSRAVLIQRGGKSRYMSIDHRPDRKDEEKRIRKLGGKLIHWGRWRVEGILAVSRAIGDVSLQPYITCEPEIIEKPIESEDEYLVLATDGIWDVMKNEDVAKLVLESCRDFANAAKKLCSEAIIMGSSDNVTAVIIDLRQRLRPPSSASSSAVVVSSSKHSGSSNGSSNGSSSGSSGSGTIRRALGS